jgi:CRP-like cAMP-binding protein
MVPSQTDAPCPMPPAGAPVFRPLGTTGSLPLTPLLIAIAAGAASAAALPLGSWIGLSWRPGARVTPALMAFGAGALLFALSVEIVADSLDHTGFLPLAVGALIGGGLFQGANQLLSSRGGFLRKVSVAARYLTREKQRSADSLLERLARVELLQVLDAEELARLVPAVRRIEIDAGTVLFHEGERGDALYLIDSGDVAVARGSVDVAVLGAGDVVGEMAVVTDAPRTATVRAVTAATLLHVPQRAFDELLAASPQLRGRLHELFTARTEEMRRHSLVPHDEIERWQGRAAERLHDEVHATRADVEDAAAERGANAARGIWLGNLLDAVPEALVLGTTVTTASLSWPLLVGIFLANAPEAMSGSVLMNAAGMSRRRILLMWASIVPVAALCAALGSVFLAELSPPSFGLIEGIAAGAMLVMIAETMLPEAFERGGAVVGISTLLGFLAALAVKTLV